MTTRALLVRIDAFIRVRRMPVTTFGRLVVNDPRLIGDLRKGRKLSGRTVARIEALLATEPLVADENGMIRLIILMASVIDRLLRHEQRRSCEARS